MSRYLGRGILERYDITYLLCFIDSAKTAFLRRGTKPGRKALKSLGERAPVKMPLGSESKPGAQDEHRVEIELRVKRALDVLGLPEPVLLALEQEIADRNAARLQRGDHALRLVRRDDAILRSLEEDHRRREPIGVVDRGALGVGLPVLWIRPDQPVEVSGLEFVGVARERLEVADAVIARARAEYRARLSASARGASCSRRRCRR